jgi:WD40 repeat protein
MILQESASRRENELALNSPLSSLPTLRDDRKDPIPPGLPSIPGYHIEAVVGHGGMGVIYRARQVRANRVVALKMIRAGYHAEWTEAERFRREAEAIARLQHPHVVPIYEVGEYFEAGVASPHNPGLPFFSMEFCAGGSLANKLGGTPLSPDDAARLVAILARAIHACHERRIIHRDLKPGNILLTEDGTPKVSDFGLAKDLGAATRTAPGAILGTPSYMAPEQAGPDQNKVGPLSDVYALGAILYECLTGRPPFCSWAVADTLRQVLHDDPVPPRHLQPRTPSDLERVCLKCLAKEPARRYGSAQELAEELERFLRGEPVLVRPIGPVGKLGRWCRRYPVVATLMIAVVVTLTVGALTATFFAVKATDAATKTAAALRLAEERQARAEWLAYSSRLALAQNEWQDVNARPARDLLAATRPDLRNWEYRYLHRLFHDHSESLTGHAGPVFSAAWSPDRQTLATGSEDRTIRLWSATDRHELRGWVAHDGTVTGVLFTPGGKELISCGADGAIKFWEVTSGKEIRALREHTQVVSGIALSPDGRLLVSASWDHTARVWEVDTGKALLTLSGHTDSVCRAVFTRDGGQVITASGDRTVKLWNAMTGKPGRTLKGHAGPIFGLALSPDGRTIATSGIDRMLKVWDAGTGRERFTTVGSTATVYCLSFSPDGQHLLVSGEDQTIQVRDAATGAVQRTLRGHAGTVYHVGFSPDGQRLVSASSDATVALWNAQREQEPRRLRGHPWCVNAVAVSGDGQQLATASHDRTVHLWNLGTRQPPTVLEGHAQEVMAVAMTGDGRLLASGGGDQTVKLWDTSTRQNIHTLQGHRSAVWSIAFSPDGQRLASAAQDGTVRVWDVATARKAVTLAGHEEMVRAVAFFPDGHHLVSGDSGAHVRVWDADGGQLLDMFQTSFPQVFGVAVSNDGRLIAAASGTSDLVPAGAAQVWDAATGREILTVRGHENAILAVAFSPDGKRLFTAGQDRTIRVWELPTGHEVLILKGAAVPITGLTLNRDGTRLVSSGGDALAAGKPGEALVWEADAP